MKIIDKKISPYQIHFDGNNYDVKQDLFEKDKNGKDLFKNHGHFTSVGYALKKIAKLKVEINEEFTISSYIKCLSAVSMNLTSIDESN